MLVEEVREDMRVGDAEDGTAADFGARSVALSAGVPLPSASARPALWSFFFFSSRRRHTRLQGDWSSDVCSSDLYAQALESEIAVVPSTAALIIISRIRLRITGPANVPISAAICAGSVKRKPCACEAAPAIIMHTAAVMVMQAPRNVSRRAHFTSAKRSRLSAMQLC